MADKVYEPTWANSSFERWARKYVAANLWRVRTTMDYEDALQVCAECFSRCLFMYRDKLDNGAWFMSIFKIAVINDFNTYSSKDAAERGILEDNEYIIAKDRERIAKRKQKSKEEVYSRDSYVRTIDFNEGYLYVALQQASSELRIVLGVMANAPSEMLHWMLDKDTDVPDVQWSRKICRLCGIKSLAHDVIGELREILRP